MKVTDLHLSLSRGIEFIHQKYLSGDGIITQMSDSAEMTAAEEVLSVYIPTYVVHSLGFLTGHTKVDEIIARTLSFLLDEMDEGGVWRFFGQSNPYPPPDFDDSCCSLIALAENGISVNTVIPDLLNSHRTDSGQYPTWIDPEMNEESDYHTDGAVNANILFYQGLCASPSSTLIEYFNTRTAEQEIEDLSIYSLSGYPVFYLITRAFCDGGVVGLEIAMNNIVEYLIDKRGQDGGWGNELDNALAMIALMNAGVPGEELNSTARYLIDRQEEDGGWPARVFFQDFSPAYYGSRSLSSALCIEALIKYSGL